MDIEAIKADRKKWLGWKNIAPIYDSLNSLAEPEVDDIKFGSVVEIILDRDYESAYSKDIETTAKMMKPWRKGPFKIGSLYIDSEWRSNLKYELLEPFFNLEGKRVADIGCNNGYYLFRMMEQKPASLTGFDPSALYYCQFLFLNRFIKSNIVYELLGVEHLPYYGKKFDTIFCLGVLYHRSDPVSTLKSLKKAVSKGGELILDTFMIDGDEDICLTPADRYSKIPNIYFIPTIPALKNWCKRAGFSEVEVLAVKKTDTEEQRKTDWIDTESLEDFLDPNDSDKTIEGYPAPKRVYIRAKVE